MISDIYYGKIKDEKVETWNENKDPYDILEEKIKINVGGWNFLSIAKKIFREEVQVDWGSFAYKANVNELRLLEEKLKCQVPSIDYLEENVDYGVIFIEGV